MAGFVGTGAALVLTGLLSGFAGLAALNYSLGAGLVGLVLALLFVPLGGALVYPALKIHSDKPAREVNLIGRLPLPTAVSNRLEQNRGAVGTALVAVGGLFVLTGGGVVIGVPMILVGLGIRRSS